MRKPTLLAQILAVNTLLICVTVLSVIAATKFDIGNEESTRRAFALVAGILSLVLVNGLVLRRRLWPLGRLIELMERVDLSQPGARIDIAEADSTEVVRLHRAFNRMLERLESERAATASAILGAQEDERARLARDLHDEANQSLTGVLLRLEASAQHSPPELREELEETKRLAIQAMEELLRLARELRPAVLDDLGLDAAVRVLLERFASQTGLQVRLGLHSPLNGLTSNEQIVVYRTVQESLSNIARHAAATAVELEVRRIDGARVVTIADDGEGFDPLGTQGMGLVGMRERARLAGAAVRVRSRPGRGTVVELKMEQAA